MWAAAWMLVLTASACEGARSTTIRVLPLDGGGASAVAMQGRAHIVSSEASLTEDLTRAGGELLRVDLRIDIANVGDGDAGEDIDRVFTRDGRVGWLGMAVVADFVRAPGWDPRPIAPGETRAMLFAADVFPLGVCTRAMVGEANPHHGLVTIGLTLLTSAGAWAFAGIDAAVTCAGEWGDAAPPTWTPPVQAGDAGRSTIVP